MTNIRIIAIKAITYDEWFKLYEASKVLDTPIWDMLYNTFRCAIEKDANEELLYDARGIKAKTKKRWYYCNWKSTPNGNKIYLYAYHYHY